MRKLDLFLDDLIDSCEKIKRYTKQINFTEFINDDLIYDAVVRNLEIIGEAVKQIPLSVRQDYPEISWQKIAGLRDILIQAYFKVNKEVIWDTVKTKINPLLEIIIDIKNNLNKYE